MKNFFLPVLVSCFILPGCLDEEQGPVLSHAEQRKAEMGKMFGSESLTFNNTKNLREGINGAGVNVYLWRASLDVFSFMSFDTIDPHGGVITTNWYSDPAMPHQRMKVNIVIYDDELRADGIKITVYSQSYKHNVWKNIPSLANTSHQLVDTVLTRARQLKSKKMKNYTS